MSKKFTIALFAVALSSLLLSTSVAHALPEGRAYEMVTPVAKDGAEAGAACCSSPDGERFGYFTLGNALGEPQSVGLTNSYVAIRGASGWESRPMMASQTYPNVGLLGSNVSTDFSTDLSRSIFLTRAVESEPNQINVFAVDLDGTSTWVSRPTPGVTVTVGAEKQYAGRSADASHIFFESLQPFTDQPGLQGTQVWEWVDGQVRLASVLPDGTTPPEGAVVGDGSNGGVGEGGFFGVLPQEDAVSEDGTKVFFRIVKNGGSLYVRENGATTRAISVSQREGSVGELAEGNFIGASADGNVAVFESKERLTDDATPGGGLYSFDLRTEDLTFLSSGADDSGAQVQGMSLVSRDGSRVYFVAGGILVPGEGVAGGHNLYVADSSGVDFIATLGDNDSQNWDLTAAAVTGRTTRATSDGRYFLFQSYEKLTDFDNLGHEEIYLYDHLDGTLACVSCGEAGHVAAGDASILANPIEPGVPQQLVQHGRPRTLTADGSRIFFQTTDSLVAQDVNDVADVYEFRRDSGTVALISAGTGGQPSEILDNTPDGRDVFFMTRDSLLARDTDRGASDVYDAREGGGFPEVPDPTPCSGEACQGPPSGPPAADAPGTSNLHGAGNVKEGARSGIKRIRKISRADRSRLAKGGKGRLRLELSRPGTVTLSGTAKIAGRNQRVVSSSAQAESAGTVTIAFALSQSGRTALSQRGSLTVALKVRFDNARPEVVAFTLESAASKGGRS